MKDNKQYGLPKLKKYPMPDKRHVKSAIRFFNYVSPAQEKELARAIMRKMKKYGLKFTDFTVGDENRFRKYVPDKYLTHAEDEHVYSNNDFRYYKGGSYLAHYGKKGMKWKKHLKAATNWWDTNVTGTTARNESIYSARQYRNDTGADAKRNKALLSRFEQNEDNYRKSIRGKTENLINRGRYATVVERSHDSTDRDKKELKELQKAYKKKIKEARKTHKKQPKAHDSRRYWQASESISDQQAKRVGGRKKWAFNVRRNGKTVFNIVRRSKKL